MSVDVEQVGHRVEELLDQVAAAEPAVAHLAEQLVTELIGLYGAGLRRFTDRLETAEPGALRDLAERDELVAGLLALHDLHPYSVSERVAKAVDELAPSIREQGGDVNLVEVDEYQAILEISGGGCGCSAGALTETVQASIRAAAPELEFVEVRERGSSQEKNEHTGGLIPFDALGSRPDLDLVGG